MRFTPDMRLRSLTSLSRSRVLRACAFTSLLGLSSLVVGCAPADDDDNGSPAAGGTGGGGSNSGAIQLTDVNNFTTTTSSLNIQTIETAPATNLDIDWSKITNDILCHPVNPAQDIDDVMFLRLASSDQAQIAKKLDGEGIAAADLKPPGAFEFLPTTTTGKLRDFAFQGTMVDVAQNYPEDATATYMLVFQKGTVPGHGAVSMVFLKPTATSQNTTVTAPSNTPDATGKCPLLTYQAKLTSLIKVPVPKAGPWVLSWSGAKTDSRGQQLPKGSIDRMLIGFYANKTPADLEADFLNLEIHDTISWELALDKTTSAVLSGAKNRKDGSAFPGFDQPTTGTWIMGLFCGSCQSPAPLFVTILEPQ